MIIHRHQMAEIPVLHLSRLRVCPRLYQPHIHSIQALRKQTPLIEIIQRSVSDKVPFQVSFTSLPACVVADAQWLFMPTYYCN